MKYLKQFAIFEWEFVNLTDLSSLLRSKKVDPKILKTFKINLVNKPISEAEPGVIQDPAGTAIGSNSKPSGGGASGAIYQKFPDLEPISNIEPGESIFNTSNGPGRKILHTHSYHFGGLNPNKDVEKVINKLARTYYNAIVRFNEKNPTLEKQDQGILNLVPVSASIYAGDFKNNDLNHLDPLYTIAGIYIAISKIYEHKGEIPRINLYYFDPKVYSAAKNILDNAR
jgi:hypothetical protein